jgi:hypothetical protein
MPQVSVRVINHCGSGTYISIAGYLAEVQFNVNDGLVQNLHLLGTPRAAKARFADDEAFLRWL